MPPKKKKQNNGESKKAQQKRKEKLVEDKTFGMKNKNKSKKVQAHIQSVTNNVMNTGDPKQRKQEEARKAAKANAKLRKKAEEAERNALFGEALLAVSKKKTTDKSSGKIEAKGRDGDDDDKKKSGTSRAMKMMYQMDAKEMEEKLKEDPNYVMTVEDEIEQQRQQMFKKLKAAGKKPTPITESTFNAWLEAKRKRKAEAAKKLVEAEMKKKKGGKGLSVLSGRDLYSYNQNLFVDDEAATDNTDFVAGAATGLENGKDVSTSADVEAVAENVQKDLFLGDDDDDLDDLDDDWQRQCLIYKRLAFCYGFCELISN